MPSIASHFACSDMVSKKLNFKSDDFFVGNILPDIIEGPKDICHYRRERMGKYLIPDIEEFLNKNNVNNDIMFGYLCHLLLDKHFVINFVLYNIKEHDNIFVADKIYKDYTIMNASLIKFFQLDINYLNKVLKMNDINNYKLDPEKYKKNVKCFNMLETDGQLRYINFDLFTKFLNETSDEIADEISKVKALKM